MKLMGTQLRKISILKNGKDHLNLNLLNLNLNGDKNQEARKQDITERLNLCEFENDMLKTFISSQSKDYDTKLSKLIQEIVSMLNFII